MKKKILNLIKKIRAVGLVYLPTSMAHAQALSSFPELSPIKLVILSVLDAYGLWKILQCVKHAIDHLGDSSKGDTTAKDRIMGSVWAIIGILMVGVVLNYLILKAGEFGARPVSSVLSGN